MLPFLLRIAFAFLAAEQPVLRTLLVTLTYDQTQMNGPPFSVSEENVKELYSDYFSIDKLCFKDTIEDEPRMQERGLNSLIETVYKLTRNDVAIDAIIK